MTPKSSTTLFLLSLLINFKPITCASCNGEIGDKKPSPTSVAVVGDFAEGSTITGKRYDRLWDLTGEIKRLREEERRYAPYESLKNDFFEAFDEEKWDAAKGIRERHFFRMETASLETLEGFYQSMPELFLCSEAANPFLQASQQQIDYFFKQHGGDLRLIESIFKASCLNPSVKLPDSFFRYSEPKVALKRIQFVQEVAPGNEEMMQKCYGLPDNLSATFKTGETVLTDALKQNNLSATSIILQRPDAHKLVNLKNNRHELPLKVLAQSISDLKIKEKLLRKFLKVAVELYKGGSDAELLRVLDGYIEGSFGNGFLTSKLSEFITQLISMAKDSATDDKDLLIIQNLQMRLSSL